MRTITYLISFCLLSTSSAVDQQDDQSAEKTSKGLTLDKVASHIPLQTTRDSCLYGKRKRPQRIERNSNLSQENLSIEKDEKIINRQYPSTELYGLRQRPSESLKRPAPVIEIIEEKN